MQRALFAVGLVVVVLGALLIASRDDPVHERVAGTESVSSAEFEDVTGIRVQHVVVTAGGGMLDVSYRVLDPDKALVVHDQERPPALMEERWGAVLVQPYHRHGSQRALHHGVLYHHLVLNTGGLLQSGDEVSVVVGEWRLPAVVVG